MASDSDLFMALDEKLEKPVANCSIDFCQKQLIHVISMMLQCIMRSDAIWATRIVSALDFAVVYVWE